MLNLSVSRLTAVGLHGTQSQLNTSFKTLKKKFVHYAKIKKDFLILNLRSFLGFGWVKICLVDGFSYRVGL